MSKASAAPMIGSLPARLYTAVAVFGTLAAIGILLASHVPLALGDYAEWTYHGVLLRDVLQGHPDPSYQLKHYPVPNSLTTVGLGLLMLVFSWQAAAKLWLAALSVFGFVSAYILNRAAGNRQGWQLIVIASAALFGGAFWFGFINFLLGVSFAMLLCAELLRDTPRGWFLNLLFVLAFFSHMVPFAFALLAFLLYVRQNNRWHLLPHALPSLLLSVWYLAGRFLHGNTDGQAGMLASVPYLTPAFAAFKVATFFKSWGFINPSVGGADSVTLAAAGIFGFLALMALDLALGAGLFVIFFRSARRHIGGRAANRFLWQAILIFFFLALVMPGAAAGISDPGGRMMQVAVWCSLLLVPAHTRWSRAALAFCSTVLLSMNLFLLVVVACRPPATGMGMSPFSAEIREFGHVLFAGRWSYYDSIITHRMDRTIYPTALFTETPSTANQLVPP